MEENFSNSPLISRSRRERPKVRLARRPTLKARSAPESSITADDVTGLGVFGWLGFLLECFSEKADAALHIDISVADFFYH